MQTITKEIKTRTLTISPQDAKETWEDYQRRLAAGTCQQRRLNVAQAEVYAKDMKSGAWALTHQGIAFDINGNLIDGQQRIYAIMLAGVPITMNVTTGIPVRHGRQLTIDAIDGGRSRGHADKLHIHGIKNANRVAASIKAIACGICGPSTSKLSFAQVSDIYHIYGKHVDDVVSMMSLRTRASVGYIMGPLAFAMEAELDIASDAVKKLATLEGLTPRHPVTALVRSMEDGGISKVMGNATKNHEAFHVVGAVLYAVKRGDQMQIARTNAAASKWFIESQQANVRKVMQIVKGVK